MIRLLLSGCVACIALLWFHSITLSFWIDEIQTWWVISGSLHDAWQRSLETQGFSPFYFLFLWCWKLIAGTSEISLRLPSVLFVLSATTYLWLLARSLLPSRKAALVSIFVFLVTDEVLSAALFARPYGLALLCATASLYHLVRWSHSGRALHLAVHVAWCVATFYAHYLFGTVALVAVFYTCIVHRPERLTTTLAAWGLGALCCVPGILHIVDLARRSPEMKMQIAPHISDLAIALLSPLTLPFFILPLFVVAVCIRTDLTPSVFQKLISSRRILWLMVWYCIPALCLFALSLATGSYFLLERYYTWQAPALALLLAALIGVMNRPMIGAAVVLAGVALITAAEPLKLRFNEDWRGAHQLAGEMYRDSEAPILLFSGINQSQRLDWLDDPDKLSFFLSPATYYALPSRPTLIPVATKNRSGDDYWTKHVSPVAEQSDALILVVFNNIGWPSPDAGDIQEALIHRLRGYGYAPQTPHQFKSVTVVRLIKTTTPQT